MCAKKTKGEPKEDPKVGQLGSLYICNDCIRPVYYPSNEKPAPVHCCYCNGKIGLANHSNVPVQRFQCDVCKKEVLLPCELKEPKCLSCGRGTMRPVESPKK